MPDIHALIPAAGSSSRMGEGVPKQYQELAGKPLMGHAVDALLAHERVAQVFVVLAPTDSRFRQFDWSRHQERLLPLYCGGATRAASVLNALMAMEGAVEPDDWVMVHDAARPCLTHTLIDCLIRELFDDNVGGLLAVPVADTLKRANENNRVNNTVSREQLWQAQTPQMFRYRLLLEAMRKSIASHITDESSAIEQMGFKPRLVMGSPSNLKVTRPDDLRFAENVLSLVH